MADNDKLYDGSEDQTPNTHPTPGEKVDENRDEDGYQFSLVWSPLRIAVFKNTYPSGDVEYTGQLERNYYKGDDAPEDDKYGQTGSIPTKHAGKAALLWQRFAHEVSIAKNQN